MRAILLFGTIKYNCYCIHSLREVKVVQLCLTLCDHMDAVHGFLQARILEWVEFPFSRECSLLPSLGDLPNPGVEPRSPSLQADSLPAELQGKPKNIGVGSLSLLQQIFPTQESNQGLSHCRWILYQLLDRLIAQLVKNPPAIQETPVRSLGWEDPLEKGKPTHSNILAWRIPWTV